MKGTPEKGKMYSVNISTSSFTEIITNSAIKKLSANSGSVNSTSEIGVYMKKLYYSVFDSTGKQIHFFQQDTTSLNFGSITDSLPKGRYTVQIATGKKGLIYDTKYSDYDITQPPISSARAQLSYDTGYGIRKPWEDTFLGKLQLTVNGNINQNIVLSRVVGLLVSAILDTIPVKANKLVVSTDMKVANTKTSGLKINSIDSSLSSNPQITIIYYGLFDSGNNKLHIIKQQSTDPGFGSLTENLHADTYTVVVAAGQDDNFSFIPYTSIPPDVLDNYILTYIRAASLSEFYGDALYKKFTITVSDSDIAQEVNWTGL